MHESTDIVAISCGVFKPELEFLLAEGRVKFPVRYLDSGLHMKPMLLYQKLEKMIQDERSQGHKMLIIYGDCHPYMIDQITASDVARVKGLNCCQIFLGKALHKRLLLENRAFFLLPEWTERWRELLITRMGEESMGFDEQGTVAFMRKIYTRIIYLDTGVQPVPREKLEDCARLFDLPLEVMNIKLEHFFIAIQDAIHKLQQKQQKGQRR
ncbi:DUF1638 domain-containing protein [Candidatus Riflebacteria bacterium]